MVASTCTESVASVRHPGTHLGGRSALHVDQEHDPTLMLERALNGARSCNHSSKAGAIVHRVIRDNTGVCQRDSSHAIDRTQLQCCHRVALRVSIVEVIRQVVVSEYVRSAPLFRRRYECSPIWLQRRINRARR